MQKRNGVKAGFVLLLAAVFFFGIGGAQAREDYPKSTIQFVIPYSPGGVTDIFDRTISDGLAKNIGGRIAMINKRGGGGMIGTSYVVKTKPDGYTLANVSAETVSIAPAFTPNMPYDPAKDLTYIAKTAVVAVGVTVRKESPFKTLEDLVSFAVMLGVGGPKGLPPAIVKKWETAIEKTLKDPAVLDAIDKTKGVVVDFKNGADYYEELMANAEIYKEIAASMPKK